MKLGSVYEIVCEARGIPHPVISWSYNGKTNTNRLENNRRRLVEVNNRDMAGKIECIATNGVGKQATAGVDMIVQCKLIVYFAYVRENCTILKRLFCFIYFFLSSTRNNCRCEYCAYKTINECSSRM